MPENVTAKRIVSLDDVVIATTPDIAESEIIELCLYQQTEVEEEENNDENSIVGSFYKRKGKPSRSKV